MSKAITAALLSVLLVTCSPAGAVVRDPVTTTCPEGTVKREFFAGFVTDGHGRIKTDEVGNMSIHVDVMCRRIMPIFPTPAEPEVYQ